MWVNTACDKLHAISIMLFVITETGRQDVMSLIPLCIAYRTEMSGLSFLLVLRYKKCLLVYRRIYGTNKVTLYSRQSCCVSLLITGQEVTENDGII